MHRIARNADLGRVLDEVQAELDGLVLMAGHNRFLGALVLQLDVASLCQRGNAFDCGANCQVEVRRFGRRDVLGLLDAAQGEQVVDEPLHALGLLLHDPEEALLRFGVVARMAAQRFDVAEHGGKRGLEFVAGIGEEIGLLLIGAHDLRHVVEHDKHEGPRRPALQICRRAEQAGDVALRRDLAMHQQGRRCGSGEGLRQPLAHTGIAQVDGEGAARRVDVDEIARESVGVDDAALAVEQYGGLGQGVGEGPCHARRRARARDTAGVAGVSQSGAAHDLMIKQGAGGEAREAEQAHCYAHAAKTHDDDEEGQRQSVQHGVVTLAQAHHVAGIGRRSHVCGLDKQRTSRKSSVPARAA